MSEFPNKNNSSTEKRAKNVNDAVIAALEELHASKDEVTVDIIDEGKKGIFGIGARDAVVRVTLIETAVKKPSAAPVKKAEEKKAEPKKVDNSAVFTQPEVRHGKRNERRERPERSERTERSERRERPVREDKPVKPVKQEEPRIWKDAEGEVSEAAVKFLTDIFDAMDIKVNIMAQTDQDNNILLTLEGENMGIVIGKRGDTLDSLQYLTSLVVNQKSEGYIKVTIDTENYREKRAEALLTLSKRLAEKVTKTGKKFTLEPMNPYERRIIHSNLQDSETVTTFSVGTEPFRKVVIAPKNSKPYFKKPGGYKGRNNSSSSQPRSRRPYKPHTRPENNAGKEGEVTAEKRGSYTTTYKADFKPQQHKAEYKSFEDYLAGHSEESKD